MTKRYTTLTIQSETATKRQDDFQAPPLTPELKKALHDRMVASRITDEVTIRMNRAGQGFFWIGGPGEEAFGASLGFQVKKGQGPDYDYLHLHYRSNPIVLAPAERSQSVAVFTINLPTPTDCRSGRTANGPIQPSCPE